MKRLIGLVCMLFILTGCSVNYNLNIDSNSITESISGNVLKSEYEVSDSDTSLNDIYYFLNNDLNALFDTESVYLRTLEDKGNKINYNFSYTYNNNYDRSNIINSCFENHLVEEDDDYLYIRLSGKFYCMYADKIDISVTSSSAVIESNAKSVKGNTYKWVIKDSDNVNIFMNISKNLSYSSGKEVKSISTFQIIGLVILVMLCGIAYLMYKRNKNDI